MTKEQEWYRQWCSLSFASRRKKENIKGLPCEKKGKKKRGITLGKIKNKTGTVLAKTNT